MDIGNYNLAFSSIAKEELIEIYQYISNNLKSKNIADNIMSQIENKILILSIFPYSCVEVATKPRNTLYRKLLVKNYVVLYKINESEKQVNIVHIYCARRNYLV